ncbi:hypothetical protein HNR60_000548 [Rhodopseudomonas rhenobacensis]|uniref:Uncharacterized protein n=1 Tax=Rhodopseudomonas rhenobacensis TaxID=87461 RepID=A0A7W8DXF6_9BRAD|nr:hypothetical protein [Rhodopseudomonas rhenobacensis]MBB5045813.1 hypothetical protein [Rhodopseudomonas rhenobacensis]
MMTLDILLLSAAAVSTVVILFAVVILGDVQQHQHQRAHVNARRIK